MLCFEEMTSASMPASSRSASSRAVLNGGDVALALTNESAVGLSVMVSTFADLARSEAKPHSSSSKTNCRHPVRLPRAPLLPDHRETAAPPNKGRFHAYGRRPGRLSY